MIVMMYVWSLCSVLGWFGRFALVDIYFFSIRMFFFGSTQFCGESKHWQVISHPGTQNEVACEARGKARWCPLMASLEHDQLYISSSCYGLARIVYVGRMIQRMRRECDVCSCIFGGQWGRGGISWRHVDTDVSSLARRFRNAVISSLN